MKVRIEKAFLEYWHALLREIPIELYEAFLLLLCISVLCAISLKGLKCGWYIACKVLLIEYTFLLFSITVIFRTYSESCSYNFCPLWSYGAIQEGRIELMMENLMNVVVFIPFGFLLFLSYNSIKWWTVLLVGTGVSFSIEALQFFLCRGFSEFDDILHNTIGCLIGFFVPLLLLLITKNIFQSQNITK